MTDLPNWAQTLIGGLGAGIAVYAGIRADLARLYERVSHAADTAKRAHERIDQILRGTREG